MNGFATIYSIIEYNNNLKPTTVNNFEKIFLRIKNKGEVYKVLFSISGDYLAISTSLNLIKVYGINQNDSNSFNKLIFKVGSMNDIKLKLNIINFCFSPNEDYIVLGKSNSKVSVYNFKKKNSQWIVKEEKEFDYHKKAVFSVRVSPYGNYIATGSSDHSAIIYC